MSEATAGEDDRKRPHDQLDIPPQRPVVHVEMVKLHHLLELDVLSVEHLPNTCHAGCEVEALACPPVDLLVLVDDERSRADKAHLALEDIQQLRKLVKREPPHEPTDSRHTTAVATM